ncbi:prepilin-type N-terminal cleavage/methylation domain-containing protein [Geomonas oryzisoli]|uniref:Prepilin-type N-terminal cleavage/methylation domain-containing protein n=1 Tax=Geomonas oryzisoli TaxID=2847992 RepID=A0ABX8J6H0_9BACT|nr:prepilin-type N-terminal cleavage/methylation domain-containing protein [Geomonas oryzisoli]QWV94030.1 prepilin-type N-terminal cleavage/methylation domain-containing protein [Geomonas oryzisoli]
MRGFTLLEVMIALAITAGVLLTVISSVNFHLSRIAADTEETTAVLLGRAKLEDPEFAKKTDTKGTFAPDHPDHKWERETTKTEIPGLNMIRLTVIWANDTKRLSLVQYAPQNAQ